MQVAVADSNPEHALKLALYIAAQIENENGGIITDNRPSFAELRYNDGKCNF